MREWLGRLGIAVAIPVLVALGAAGAMVFNTQGADAEQDAAVNQQPAPEEEKDGCPQKGGGGSETGDNQESAASEV